MADVSWGARRSHRSRSQIGIGTRTLQSIQLRLLVVVVRCGSLDSDRTWEEQQQQRCGGAVTVVAV